MTTAAGHAGQSRDQARAGLPGYLDPVHDKNIRSALHAQFQAEHGHDPTTVFVDELDLCGQVRVDMAVVNGTLSGFELKSDRDTLRRLPMQIQVYGRVLDHATLVVGERHHDHAVRDLPDWWGVIVAAWDGTVVTLHEERISRWNRHVEPLALAQLLWRSEALEELAVRGIDKGLRTKPRWTLWAALADQVPLTDLRELVRQRLKNREGWRARSSLA
jgi:hypothetical protein